MAFDVSEYELALENLKTVRKTVDVLVQSCILNSIADPRYTGVREVIDQILATVVWPGELQPKMCVGLHHWLIQRDPEIAAQFARLGQLLEQYENQIRTVELPTPSERLTSLVREKLQAEIAVRQTVRNSLGFFNFMSSTDEKALELLDAAREVINAQLRIWILASMADSRYDGVGQILEEVLATIRFPGEVHPTMCERLYAYFHQYGMYEDARKAHEMGSRLKEVEDAVTQSFLARQQQERQNRKKILGIF
jgi:hypothetical protein